MVYIDGNGINISFLFPLNRFLANCFARSVREATIKCETTGHYVDETSRLLAKLSSNVHLRKIFLEPSSCTFEWPIRRTDSKDEG